jgi:hypothetical protein
MYSKNSVVNNNNNKKGNKMKKSILAISLLIASTASFAGDHSTETSKSTTVEASILNYDFGNESETGGKLSVLHKGENNIGLSAETEFSSVNSTSMSLSALAATYEIPLFEDKVTFKPSLGLFHSSVEHNGSETGLFAGAALEGDVVKDLLSESVYMKFYDSSDYFDDESLLGVKLKFKYSEEVDFFVAHEDFGDVDTTSIGASFKF